MMYDRLLLEATLMYCYRPAGEVIPTEVLTIRMLEKRVLAMHLGTFGLAIGLQRAFRDSIPNAGLPWIATGENASMLELVLDTCSAPVFEPVLVCAATYCFDLQDFIIGEDTNKSTCQVKNKLRQSCAFSSHSSCGSSN